MPLYDYVCSACRQTTERYLAHGAADESACDTCAAPLHRSPVSGFSIRTPAPTGAKMADGTFVRGTWGPPPRRVARRIKTFA